MYSNSMQEKENIIPNEEYPSRDTSDMFSEERSSDKEMSSLEKDIPDIAKEDTSPAEISVPSENPSFSEEKNPVNKEEMNQKESSSEEEREESPLPEEAPKEESIPSRDTSFTDHPQSDDVFYYHASDPLQRDSFGFHQGDSFSRQEERPYIPEEREKKLTNPNYSSILVGAVALLAFAIGFGSMFFISSRLMKNHNVDIQTVEPSRNLKKSGVSDASDTVKRVLPCVVSITSVSEVQDLFGFYSGEQKGAGSGFIIAKEKDKLFIATNNHVISNAKNLSVCFSDTTTATAQVVGYDTDSDLALISVNLKDMEEETVNHVKVAVLGDSDEIKVGQNVIAIGNALGYGPSVTCGVLSAKNREIPFADGSLSLLQTDAAINPGNSGGVLTDVSGTVIGINNAKLADTTIEGMGYAIPINDAKPILEELKNSGHIDKENSGFLGIVGKTIDNNASVALGFPTGVYITEIIDNSPAEEADLHAGDIITSIGDEPVASVKGLQEKIGRKRAGDKIVLSFKRLLSNGKYEDKTAKITLGKASDFTKEEENKKESEESPYSFPNPDDFDIDDFFN